MSMIPSPKRQMILDCLKERPKCMYEIWQEVNRKKHPHAPKCASTIGYHLKSLVKDKLVERLPRQPASVFLDKIPYKLVKQK